MEQFCAWFDLEHVSRSPAKFNPEKLLWLNQQYLKVADDTRLAGLVEPRLAVQGLSVAGGPPLEALMGLLKDRASTLVELTDAASLFYRDMHLPVEVLAEHLSDEAKPALVALRARLQDVSWERAALNDCLKAVTKEYGLKLPKLAMPLRVLVTGVPQTPAIDATLELLGRDKVLRRLDAGLARVSLA